MSQITTEAEWLSCDDPRELADFARGRVDSQRFRWLAAEWGRRIRHVFEPSDLPWFDAFDQWVAGTGPHPAEVCLEPAYYPLGRPMPALSYAIDCAEAIRQDDPLRSAAYAGVSASEDYTYLKLKADFDHSHRGRSAAKRAADKARNEAWWAARAENKVKVMRECCDQLRDVAGNPFRQAVILPDWRTSTVMALVRGITIELAFYQMPILADALEDAGCDDAQVLEHCRGENPHVRGCWVIDLLEGRPL
jgi:hypothetical protein